MTPGSTDRVSTDQIGRIFREGSGRTVAALIRLFGDIDVAEDAVQDAFVIALDTWPTAGLPPEPGAWMHTTARNRAIDRLRRESLGRALLSDVVREREDPSLAGDSALTGPGVEPTEGPVQDDQLRLIFTCCHPSLAPEAQVALTLRLLCGLATRDVARAFLVEESTMAQRLVRAKRKIKSAHIPYAVPAPSELPARLMPVLAVTYLVYNAGADKAPGPEPTEDLCVEGLRLAQLLHDWMPEQPEVSGLLALLLLAQSRRSARFDSQGQAVLLRDQDRSLWSRASIARGQALLRECLRRNRPGPYQLQAAIQAVHADAPSLACTDWPQIVALYDHLLDLTPSPIVALNRAVAVAEVQGPAAALDLLAALDLDGYYLFHATRGDLLERLDQGAGAAEAFRRAASQSPSAGERAQLEARAAAAGPARSNG